MAAIAQMRHDISKIYDCKPGWLAKVNRMPDKQVIAIWHKFMEQGMDPEVIKKDGSRSKTTEKLLYKAAVDADALPELRGKMVYYCTECHEEYVRDNPELTECEFCGSIMIERCKLWKLKT